MNHTDPFYRVESRPDKTSKAKAPAEAYSKLVLEEQKRVAEFKREGLITASYIGDPASPPWHAFLVFREESAEAVR